MKIELLQTIETALKNKNLDIIDLLTVVETYLQDDYEVDFRRYVDFTHYVRLRDSLHTINNVMKSIEDEYNKY